MHRISFTKINTVTIHTYCRERDPRTLFGTYNKIDDIGNYTFDTSLIDQSIPIYQHTTEINPDDDATKSYIFKIINVGFVLSETLPLEGTTITVFMTCFEDNLFECQYYKWYWGYNKYEFSIPKVKVMGNQCSGM